MTRVEPKVFLLAQTCIDPDEVERWLQHLGGSAVSTHITGVDGERLIELSARRCYKAFDIGLNPNVTQIRKVSYDYHANILSSGHGSVLEHATCTWAFEDVSRVFTHELVRNRAGNAFSQESLRYVRLTDLRFWLPPEIDSNPVALQIALECLTYLESVQLRLADCFGISVIREFSIKKRLTSLFRRFAPMGLATGIVLTCNMRSLRWLIEQRTSRAAEAEIRMVFDQVAERAIQMWPMLFQDFQQVDSGDGLFEWVPTHHKV